MSDDVLDDTVPVRSSHWRIAVMVAVLLGGGLYLAGRLGAADDAGRVPAQFVMMTAMLAPPAAVLLFAGWWVLLGDGKWYKRILAEIGCFVAFVGALILAHPTIRPLTGMWGLPLSVGVTGLVLIVTPFTRLRYYVGPLVWLLAITPWLIFRLDGVTGAFVPDVSLRFQPSTGEMAANLTATSMPTEPLAKTESSPISDEDWPGFRGSRRTSEVSVASFHGWDGSQPKELWRHTRGKVGPAWSSFCVIGDVMYTQEQRGESESVVCYKVDSGKEVWARGESGAHSDLPSGKGPRATPTFANGSVYAVSATGIVSCLRAATGEPIWTINLGERFEATKPQFGLATSPLVLGDLVIIHPGSPASPRLVALEAATGKTRWATEAKGTDGYSSPHVATIHGVDQVLLFNGSGLSSHDPASGKELWYYEWKVATNEPTTVQPLVLPDGRVVIGGGNIGLGSRCIKVLKQGEGWSAEEAWRTTLFTPGFNDVVRSGDYLYGLDRGGLSCIRLSDGQRMWKEGDYGSGQLLLVGDKLLILSERGKLCCVLAKHDDYEEVWKMDAVKGKTWNHPAIARGRLFIRNMDEMVIFDLPGYSSEVAAPSTPSPKK